MRERFFIPKKEGLSKEEGLPKEGSSGDSVLESVFEKDEKDEKNKKEKEFVEMLEFQGFFEEEKIKEDYLEIKEKYKQHLIKAGKRPTKEEDWDELITREIDKNYACYIKEKVDEPDKRLIDDFLDSDDENPLPLKKRQEFSNILFRNNYSLYANREGEMVSMSDYLREYYKDTGVDCKIVFKTIDPEVKMNLVMNILISKFMEDGLNNDLAFQKAFYAIESGDEEEVRHIRYILNDEVAIPHLITEAKDTKIETPLVAGNDNYYRSLRSKEKDEFGCRKRKGHFIQFLAIHAPEHIHNIQHIISTIIHEIDHVIPKSVQKDLDKGLLTEGTAEVARMDFMKTQHKYLEKEQPLNGYDYQEKLTQVLNGYMFNEKITNPKNYRYAHSFIIAEGYRANKGEKDYRKIFYGGENDINKKLGDVVEIRKMIDERLMPLKNVFKQILLGKLDKK